MLRRDAQEELAVMIADSVKKTILQERNKSTKYLSNKYKVSRSFLWLFFKENKVYRGPTRIPNHIREKIRNEPKQRLKILAAKYNVSITSIFTIRSE